MMQTCVHIKNVTMNTSACESLEVTDSSLVYATLTTCIATIASLQESSDRSETVNRSECLIAAEKFLVLSTDQAFEHKFISRYRLTQREFDFLMSLLPKQKKFRWPLRLQVMIYLEWLASKVTVRQLERLYGISKSTIQDFLVRVCSFIVQISDKIIFLPRSASDIENVTHGFHEKSAHNRFMKNVLGAIDGSLIEVTVPESKSEDYYDRHSNKSINLSAICDHRKVIRWVRIGMSGACHDFNVLKCSTFFKQGSFPPPGYVLLGDSAYANTFDPIKIISPYKNYSKYELLPQSQLYFNLIHSRTRSTIECCFGDLKSKWKRITLGPLTVKLLKAPDVVLTACILNNITLVDQSFFSFTEKDLNITFPPEPRPEDFENANLYRDHFAVSLQISD